MRYVFPSSFSYKFGSPQFKCSFRNNNNEYLYGCKNSGRCSEEEAQHSKKKAVRVLNGELEYADITVCNKCLKPVNSTAALELNRWLGISRREESSMEEIDALLIGI